MKGGGRQKCGQDRYRKLEGVRKKSGPIVVETPDSRDSIRAVEL